MTDCLIFRGTETKTHGWIGPWPPPAEMNVITAAGGGTAVYDPNAGLGHGLVLAELLARGAVLRRYRLHTASAIPDAAPADASWFRGAEYIEIEAADHA